MVDPAAGPFLFDTSAEGWLARNASPDVVRWLYSYLGLHQCSVSPVTVTERVRGYSMLWRRSAPGARGRIEVARVALPGVMAYGSTEDEAIRKVKSIALQVLADMIESGDDVPDPLKVLFAA